MNNNNNINQLKTNICTNIITTPIKYLLNVYLFYFVLIINIIRLRNKNYSYI